MTSWINGVQQDQDTSANNIFVDVSTVWTFGRAALGDGVISNPSIDAVLDDLVISPHYWDSADVTAIYNLGRSTNSATWNP